MFYNKNGFYHIMLISVFIIRIVLLFIYTYQCFYNKDSFIVYQCFYNKDSFIVYQCFYNKDSFIVYLYISVFL